MGLKRGDLVVVSAPGDYGKPRPGLVIQSDRFDGNGSIVVLLMTSVLKRDNPLLRHTVEPSQTNGLVSPSDVMIDKIFTIPRERMGRRIGSVTRAEMGKITAALAVFLEIR